MLKLRLSSGLPESTSNRGLLSSGVEIECDLREIEHPEGRFVRRDGTRYDVCVMEVMADPSLRPPSISRGKFVGDRADTQSGVLRLGNVRSSSFRLSLDLARGRFRYDRQQLVNPRLRCPHEGYVCPSLFLPQSQNTCKGALLFRHAGTL